MKKHLLIGMALSIGGAAFAQSTTAPVGITPQKMNPKVANQALPYLVGKGLGGQNDSFESMVQAINPKPHPRSKVLGYTTIGTTSYQLQTNASVCNRIVKNSDGTICATWTMAIAADWSDRGTGYNYFNGTSWGAAPTARIEAVRTGFTNVGVLGVGGTGAEFTFTHEAPASGTGNGTHFTTRPAKGTGTWTDGVIGALDTWPRLSVGGAARTSLHVIAQTSGATTPIVKYHGQDGALSYSRSTDGGSTWGKLRTVIPAIDSSHYLGFGGDSYAMDAKGDTIAIVLGGFTVDVILLKSVDNGNTWTKTIVKAFPIPMYTAATMITDVPPTDGVADTIQSNDASVAVLLDNNGMAHVWFGNMRVFCNTPGTTSPAGLSYFPGTDGLMYWNEYTPSAAPVAIAGVQDINGDGMINVDFDNSGGGLLGYGSYDLCLTSMPNAGIDASGKLYVAYSSIYEGINDQGVIGGTGSASPGKSFRHEYLMRSDDNGTTWCDPIDLTDPDITSGTYDYLEGVYGAVAKNVDGFVHVIVQQDNSPGHGVSTTTTPDPQSGDAEIEYYKVPVANTCAAAAAGIQENAAVVNAMNLYPNPANNSVNVTLNTSKAAKADIKVFNVMGQQIAHLENNLNMGNNIITLDITKYQQGVYFVNALVDGKNFTQKLIVK